MTITAETNVLNRLLAEDFSIQDFYVGYDFLVLQLPCDLESGKTLELSLWAYAQGGRDDSPASAIELLVAMKDADENLDILLHEDFRLRDYTSWTEAELLVKMEDVLKKVNSEQKLNESIKSDADFLIFLERKKISVITIEENSLFKVFDKEFLVSKYPVGHDFLVLSAPISKKERVELSVWVHGYETIGNWNKPIKRNLEILIGVRDEHDDIDFLEQTDFMPEDYNSEVEAIEAMLEFLRYKTVKYVKAGGVMV